MSRAYRVEVRESENVTVKASDEIATCLELLEILSPEEMADLLIAELKKKGFDDTDGKISRKNGETTITVDPCKGEVVVKTNAEQNKNIEVKKVGHAIDDIKGSGVAVQKQLVDRAKTEIEQIKERDQKALQTEVSKELEDAIKEFQPELNDIINRVTREALKKKAAQMGRVQEVSEDAETGSMTITVEV